MLRLVGAGRAVLGAAVLVAPHRLLGLLVGRPPAEESATALRLFGVRDLALGLATLTAGPASLPRWAAVSALVDGADALILARAGGLPRPQRAAAVAVAAGAAAGGLLTRRTSARPAATGGPGGC